MRTDWDMLTQNDRGVSVSDGVLEVRTVAGSRWLPRDSDPVTTLEKIIHRSIKIIAWLPVYTAIVVTLTLLVLIFTAR